MDEDWVREGDETATTADMTQAADEFSGSDSDDNEEGVFAAENEPRPPPDRLLYNGEGTQREHLSEGRDVTKTKQRPGRSTNCDDYMMIEDDADEATQWVRDGSTALTSGDASRGQPAPAEATQCVRDGATALKSGDDSRGQPAPVEAAPCVRD